MTQKVTPDRFGDATKLPDVDPLQFLTDSEIDRAVAISISVACETWAVLEVQMRSDFSQEGDVDSRVAEERARFVRRIFGSALPEGNPAQPVRPFLDT